jgi:biofilm PGA synthesis lipoprotein PgaB
MLDLTDRLMNVVDRWRPGSMSARNLFSGSLLYPDAELWLAQDFELFLQRYDYVALMAMPYFENADNAKRFYEGLVTAVGSHPQGRIKTIFELQTVDWRTNTPIASTELRATMRWLQANGVRHLAYYPDDFIVGHPQLRELRQGMSLAQYPIEVPK